jgi:CheY-like chemotaxis protein
MRKLRASRVRTVLLVDDEETTGKAIKRYLSETLNSDVTWVQFPREAFNLAQNRLYDMVLIDVWISYKGNQLGGLQLYSELTPRYGASSLIAYSHMINEDLLARYGGGFNFVEVNGDPVAYTTELCSRATECRAKQTCFVAMPFDRELKPYYGAIKGAIRTAGFRPVRLDEVAFTNSITDQIRKEISDSKAVVFVTIGRNPNAFFEAGYAHALNKAMVVVTDDYDNLPFDVRNVNALAIGDDPEGFRRRLGRHLSGLVQSS